MEIKMNSVYLAYSAAHGKTHEEMIASDRIKYPGGVMCGFQLWVAERKREFLQQHPEHNCFGKIANLELWYKYISEKFPYPKVSEKP